MNESAILLKAEKRSWLFLIYAPIGVSAILIVFSINYLSSDGFWAPLCFGWGILLMILSYFLRTYYNKKIKIKEVKDE